MTGTAMLAGCVWGGLPERLGPEGTFGAAEQQLDAGMPLCNGRASESLLNCAACIARNWFEQHKPGCGWSASAAAEMAAVHTKGVFTRSFSPPWLAAVPALTQGKGTGEEALDPALLFGIQLQLGLGDPSKLAELLKSIHSGRLTAWRLWQI